MNTPPLVGSHCHSVCPSRVRRISPLALISCILALLWLTAAHQALAGTFPGSAVAESKQSYACFRVTVDPLFLWLFEDPDGAGPKLRYPGFNGSTLTSPGLSDPATIIGESMGYGSPPFPPISTPSVDIGGTLPPSQGNLNIATAFPGLYPSATWPYPFPAPSPLSTMWTELQKATLNGSLSNCVNTPLLPPLAPVLVKVGFYNNLPRSVGMVQRGITATVGNDFPARSFFDVFAEATLPLAPGRGQDLAFPPGGIKLYNDDPLYVLNDSVDRLPPTLGYLHDPATLAVPLKFKFDQPDGSGGYYWHAGDVIGNIELAGHGVFDPCSKNKGSDFVAQILGVPGHSSPSAPVGGMYPNSLYPWPTSTYDSIVGTNMNGQPLDALTYTNGGSGLSFRHLSVSNLLDSITLPTFGNSATYTNSNVIVRCEASFDLLNYFPGSATGTIQVLIVNTNISIDATNGGTGGVTNYYTELQSLDLLGSSFFGSFRLRESPTNHLAGKHIVRTGSPGYRIAGYFDSKLQLSLNNGVSWTPPDYPLRLKLTRAPCGANVCKLYVTHPTASQVAITWANPNYTLQGATSLVPADWTDIAGASPVTLPASTYQFFRLTCQ